jgi:predicted PurR-regulated permease PerM
MNTQLTVKWSILLAATAIVIYLCVLMLEPFFLVIAWSTVLAIVSYPLYRQIARKTGRPTLSALITSALVVLVVVVPLLFVAGLAMSQFLSVAQSLQDRFRDAPNSALFAWTSSHLRIDGSTVAGWVQRHGSELAGTAGQYTLTLAGTVTGGIVSFGFTIIALFLLLCEADAIVALIPELLPFDPVRSRELLTRLKDVVNGSVYGVVVTALIYGALGGLYFWLLGVPSAALWGMVTVFTSVLPVVGGTIVWGPGAVYLAVNGHWLRAIVLAIASSLSFSGVDHILRPRLVAGRIGLSQLVMFFALLGGLHVFGVLGIVLGPVVFAAGGSIIQILREPTRQRRRTRTEQPSVDVVRASDEVTNAV